MHALAAHDGAGRLVLVDASAPDFSHPDLAAAGIARDALMRLIHARDADGQWFIGIPVFEQAYAAIGLHRVAALWGHPRLRPLWDRAYPWVARFRQPLSRLGLNKAYGWLVRRAAARAQRRAQACAQGRCALPDQPPSPP